jgi:hypothetical protein
MARSKQDILNTLIASKNSNAVLAAWNNSSVVAIWLLFLDIIAEGIYLLETIFDFHKLDVNDTIAAIKPHTLQWYAGMAKNFRYGQNLPADSDTYDNTGLTAAQIAATKIVAYAAVVEKERGLRIKVAKLVNGLLEPLTAPELLAFKAYMSRIKDAGVRLEITSTVADYLKLNIRVKYNPLVLTNTGARIDGVSVTPVADAIRNYLNNLPFNGVLSLQKLTDAIQVVDGVADLAIDGAWQSYALTAFVAINIDAIPDSGYFAISNADLNITFISA